MGKSVVSGEEGEELKRLYVEFSAASERTRQVLASKGMNSSEFSEADKATGLIWHRIREILD